MCVSGEYVIIGSEQGYLSIRDLYRYSKCYLTPRSMTSEDAGVVAMVPDCVCRVQFVSVHGAHGHASASALRLGHQGAEPRPRRPGRRQADHRGRRQAGGGKELVEELHRSESGGFAPHVLPPAGAAASSFSNPPAAPARPARVQPHVELPETIAAPVSFTFPQPLLLLRAGCCSNFTSSQTHTGH